MVEQNAVLREGPEDPGQRLVEALAKTLQDAGLTTADTLRSVINTVDEFGKNAAGPRLVARAWVDPAFRELLLRDAGVR